MGSPWNPKGAHGAQKLQGPGSRAGTAAFGPHGPYQILKETYQILKETYPILKVPSPKYQVLSTEF